MESIGAKLKTQREQKGYSIEQVARDTNIAKRYLEALELEDFTVFPGDPYLIGFLRNYADYLGLDPEEIVALYRNFTIQSQPVPMEELIVNRDRKPLLIGLLVVVVIVALGAVGYFLYPLLFDRLRAETGVPAQVGDEAYEGRSVFTLADEILQRRFVEGDAVLIALKGEEYRVEFTSISDGLTLTVPGGTNTLRIGDMRAVDLTGDSDMDIEIYVSDIDASGEVRSVVARVDRIAKAEEPGSDEREAGLEAAGASFAVTTVGAPGSASRAVEPVVLRSADAIERFRMSFIFRGYCLFRYVVDAQTREERHYNRGETVDLDIRREVYLWVSNAGNVSARVGGVEVDLGGPGQVVARRIGWTRNDDTGRLDLVLSPIY